ncbi:GDSL esterase/lipase [Dichanthelium oligosanthes]|uniref:GDSL esterase/lipase n=1 Tax=Dichanthelium oligosanthes TaxID=888268 RepID=A0A1E5V3J7_9POAL|nr:GDSL esterase/lipase [Dichanthelium oligosanthes]
MMKLFAACFVLVFLVNVARVAECRKVAGGDVSTQRRHQHRHRHSPPPPPPKRSYKLFVFGDDFADNGNGPSDIGLGFGSRAWRFPFGMSDRQHDRKATGRYSDGLVQSDFLAKIMGHAESPPPYMSDNWDDGIDASGLNFAIGEAGALEVPSGVLKLGAQVQQLRDLVRDGLVDDRDFEESVALVAYSGNDYASATMDNLDDLVTKVSEELGNVVSQLLDLGVTKVLVNTVPPFGCSPWMARHNNYSSCDDDANVSSDRHNKATRDRLADEEDVMLLDVNSIITDLVAPKEGSALYSKQFTERLRPCCEADDDGDGGSYCGLDQHFYLCDHPEEFFFWDVIHPTHAGWRAVMQLLQGPIMAFLGISNLEHL